MVGKLKYFKIGFISLIFMLVLTAFGCKKQEEDQDSNESLQIGIDATEQITYNQTEIQDTNNKDNQSNKEESVAENNNIENISDSEEDEERLLLEKAEKLAEIFGTFTNKDKESYKNLKDLKQYSTVKLNSWFDEKSKIPIDSKAAFYGVTTSALSSVFLNKNNSNGKLLVTVKKEEITANNNTPKISYNVILMDFEKIEETWKLNGIYWQD